MENALRIIISGSATASQEAIDCMRAIREDSPVVALRFERVVKMALSDPRAEFTQEERRTLSDALLPADTSRSFVLRIRLTDEERSHLTAAAAGLGQSMSEYARRKIFPGYRSSFTTEERRSAEE